MNLRLRAIRLALEARALRVRGRSRRIGLVAAALLGALGLGLIYLPIAPIFMALVIAGVCIELPEPPAVPEKTR